MVSELTVETAGQGFVRVDEELAKNHVLPKAIKWTDSTKGGSFYGTAIVHSIHCLYTIMAEYDALAMGLKYVEYGVQVVKLLVILSTDVRVIQQARNLAHSPIISIRRISADTYTSSLEACHSIHYTWYGNIFH